MKAVLRATFALAALFGIGGSATAGIVNGSFEDGFSGWNRIGSTSIRTITFGSGPTDGLQQALLSTAAGRPVADQSSIETFLGLTAGSLDTVSGGNPIHGSAISQTINVSAGAVLSFDFNFLTDEDTPGSFNDFAFWTLSDSANLLADTTSAFVFSPTVFSEETGYGTFSYTFTTGGTYLLGFGVMHEEDFGVDSGLLVDNVFATPEPSTLGMWGILGFAAAGGHWWRKRRAAALAVSG